MTFTNTPSEREALNIVIYTNEVLNPSIAETTFVQTQGRKDF